MPLQAHYIQISRDWAWDSALPPGPCVGKLKLQTSYVGSNCHLAQFLLGSTGKDGVLGGLTCIEYHFGFQAGSELFIFKCILTAEKYTQRLLITWIGLLDCASKKIPERDLRPHDIPQQTMCKST